MQHVRNANFKIDSHGLCLVTSLGSVGGAGRGADVLQKEVVLENIGSIQVGRVGEQPERTTEVG